MKKIKNILLLAILVLAFSSCNKCKECSGKLVVIMNGETITVEGPEYGVDEPMFEVCRDDFDSNDDYKDFIVYLEEDYGLECKSDFWN